jgi:hypothetical protein
MKNRKKIVMIKTAKGADEHIHVNTFLENHEYEVSECLANSFVNSGNAEFVTREKQKQPHQNKALSSSDYENKSDKSKRRDK